MKLNFGVVFCAALLMGAAFAATPVRAQPAEEKKIEALSMDELLRLVEQGRINEDAENRRREARFRSRRNEQQRLLDQAEVDRRREEARSKRLEAQFEENQEIIAIKREQLSQSLGSLIELFGHMTAAANDLRGNFETSIISSQYAGRVEFLDELVANISESERLPSMNDIEKLWFYMQQEATESGKVVSFNAEVIEPNGERRTQRVVRVGSFNLVDEDGNYLDWVSEKSKIEKLARQPSGPFNGWAEDLAAADEGLHPFGIDPTGPTGGSFLASLIDAPTLIERWQQGRVIGFLITLLGAFALFLALSRLIRLSAIKRGVDAQLKSDKPAENNPLGRVLGVYEQNAQQNLDVLELKMGEAILRERPEIERGLALLKIIAAVAPLMGLLGTVTGMILTFQGIVIFGAGDPKSMAGGISQALVTTVLGLIVAIPTVLLHTLVSGRSNAILHILEEESTGIVAARAERAA